MRLLALLLLTSLAFPAAVYADEPQLGPATLRVNVCTRLESNPARFALVPVHPNDLGPYIARGDRAYVTASECPGQTVFFVPQDQPTRRAVPVEVEPFDEMGAVGGGQGRVPGSEPDVPRRATPVHVEVLPDEGATGGGQGEVPTNDEPTRRGIPVELEPIGAWADVPSGGGQSGVPEDDVWRQAIPVEAESLPMGEDPGSAGGLQPIGDDDGADSGMPDEAAFRVVLAGLGDTNLSSSSVVAGAMAMAAGFWIRRRGRF